MAIISYLDHTSEPELETQLAVLSQQTRSTLGLLSLIGDYWTKYYQDTPSLAYTHSGFIAAAGRQFTRLFETLLSGNIIDIPVEQGISFDLLCFYRSDFETIYAEDGTVDSYFVSLEGCDITNIEFLTVNLFESEVILEKGKHFDVDNNGIYFYVDIFTDPAIVAYEYTMSSETTQAVLLWGTSIALSSYYIYQRYGRFLYRKAADSYQYKWIVTSLMRYYTGAKTPTNIKKILDILFGIPYARVDGEVITEIQYVDANLLDWTEERTDEAPYIRITTDHNVYYTYGLSTVKYQVGDAVPKWELFAEFCDIQDYINTPGWWETSTMGFPDYLFNDQETADNLTENQKFDIMDQILKYNTVYTQVNITFESYDLYMQIMSELYSIIENGFPVYLNPYVEVIFRTIFVDDTEFTDKTKEELWFESVIVFLDEVLTLEDGSLPMAIAIKLWDVVRYMKTYNGFFWHEGEIKYKGWRKLFAVSRMSMYAQLTEWLENFEPPQEDLHASLSLIPWYDPFCQVLVYNGRIDHDADERYHFWVTNHERMITRLTLNVDVGFDDMVKFDGSSDSSGSAGSSGGGYTDDDTSQDAENGSFGGGSFHLSNIDFTFDTEHDLTDNTTDTHALSATIVSYDAFDLLSMYDSINDDEDAIFWKRLNSRKLDVIVDHTFRDDVDEFATDGDTTAEHNLALETEFIDPDDSFDVSVYRSGVLVESA